MDRTSITNVSSVAFRSPFRYPGGKTWLVPIIRRWLTARTRSCEELIEPFAGGGIVGLTVAFDKLAERVTLVEIDPDVAAVWETILNGKAKWLADRIYHFAFSSTAVRRALGSRPTSKHQRAFVTILRNRVQRGGILAPGAGLLKRGERDRGIHSRWYPQTLRGRILDVAEIKDRFRFVREDGLKIMRLNVHRKDVAFFVDPPYADVGTRLYKYSCIDPVTLFKVADKLQGEFLMTYANTAEIRRLAQAHGFETTTVPMKNTHNAKRKELLISRDLSWLRD